MTITANRVGVWILDDTYKKVSSGCWVYSAGGDPPSPGELWLWGCSGQGQLGDNTTVPKSSPIQIPGTSWGAVRTGQYHTLATKTDGTLWSWGRGTEGRLGDNTTILLIDVSNQTVQVSQEPTPQPSVSDHEEPSSSDRSYMTSSRQTPRR